MLNNRTLFQVSIKRHFRDVFPNYPIYSYDLILHFILYHGTLCIFFKELEMTCSDLVYFFACIFLVLPIKPRDGKFFFFWLFIYLFLFIYIFFCVFLKFYFVI